MNKITKNAESAPDFRVKVQTSAGQTTDAKSGDDIGHNFGFNRLNLAFYASA